MRPSGDTSSDRPRSHCHARPDQAGSAQQRLRAQLSSTVLAPQGEYVPSASPRACLRGFYEWSQPDSNEWRAAAQMRDPGSKERSHANAEAASGVIGLPVELGGWVEKHLDRNAAAIVNSCSCLSSAICAAKPQADDCTVAEVAPPELALGPHDRDRESFVGLLVADGERVLSAGSEAGD